MSLHNLAHHHHDMPPPSLYAQVLEEQRRLRASMGAMDDSARRMRSLVTHKKLKEIALAQADEVRGRLLCGYSCV